MGLTIGQVPALLGANGIGRVRRPTFFDSGSRDRVPSPGQGDREEAPALLGQRDEEPPRVGLGPGTLSGPAAALNTIQRTIREVRETQPTLREINIGFQRQAAEERALIREQRTQDFFNEGRTRDIESTTLIQPRENRNRVQFQIPEPAAQARAFINTLNDAAGAAQARFSESESAPQRGPSFQVNGQRVSISDRPGSLLNLTA